MKAILTVPDDWERGICSKCPLHWNSNGDFYCLILHQLWWFDGIEPEDCPLEIQKELMTKPDLCRVECKDCSCKEVCSYVNKE